MVDPGLFFHLMPTPLGNISSPQASTVTKSKMRPKNENVHLWVQNTPALQATVYKVQEPLYATVSPILFTMAKLQCVPCPYAGNSGGYNVQPPSASCVILHKTN